MHRFLAALVFCLFLVLDRAQAAVAPATVPATVASNGMALESALSTVDADEIRADLAFIASDELEGRDTPSAGLRIAARFLRARLQRLGWQPGAKDGFFYTWPVEKKALDPEQCQVAFAGQQGKLGKDYFLTGFGATVAREAGGEIVCAGAGGKAELQDLDVEGKWVLVLDRDQDLRDAKSELGKRAPAGLLLVPASDYAGKPYAERFAADLTRQKDGRVQPVGEPGAEEPERRRTRGVPTLYLEPAMKSALLAAARVDEAALTAGRKLELSFTERRALVGSQDGRTEVENVCGFWPGSDPVLKNEVLIVSAHYDHVGVVRGQIHNGADDNGSGTCTLLALAESLRDYGPMRRSVLLMWVAGEEKGLWGSAAWTKAPWLPEGCKAVADINIDMVGRNAPDKLLVTPTAKHKSYSFLTKVAETYAPQEGFPVLDSADEYWTRSDHYNFVKAGIPACFLFSDVHEDYHQPTDDVEKIDFDKIKRVSRLVLRMLDALQNDQIDG